MNMKSDYAKKLLELSKNTSASIADDGLLADCDFFVDTGCYALNALISGSIYKGMPGNKIIGLAGDPATGKTYFALSIAYNFQQQDPNALVLYFDSESAITSDMLEGKGFDMERVLIFPVSTIEEFRNQAMAILVDHNKQDPAKRPKLLMVLDSLGMLSSSKEVEDIGDGKNVRDMTKSQLMKGAFRVLTLELAKANVPMIVTAHSYDQIGCLGAGTKVHCENELKEIQNIVVGDLVVTAIGLKPVTNVFEYDCVDPIEFELEDGTTFVCSKEHKFLVGRGIERVWVRAEEITTDDHILELTHL